MGVLFRFFDREVCECECVWRGDAKTPAVHLASLSLLRGRSNSKGEGVKLGKRGKEKRKPRGMVVAHSFFARVPRTQFGGIRNGLGKYLAIVNIDTDISGFEQVFHCNSHVLLYGRLVGVIDTFVEVKGTLSPINPLDMLKRRIRYSFGFIFYEPSLLRFFSADDFGDGAGFG